MTVLSIFSRIFLNFFASITSLMIEKPVLFYPGINLKINVSNYIWDSRQRMSWIACLRVLYLWTWILENLEFGQIWVNLGRYQPGQHAPRQLEMVSCWTERHYDGWGCLLQGMWRDQHLSILDNSKVSVAFVFIEKCVRYELQNINVKKKHLHSQSAFFYVNKQ